MLLVEMLRLHSEDSSSTVKMSSDAVTDYSGLPSFTFVAVPSVSCQRQRAFNVVTSNLYCSSQVHNKPVYMYV